MGLFKIGGANKNDVKLAKIELEKAKMEEKKLKKMSKEEKEELKRKQIQEEVNAYLEYTKLNINPICKVILELKNETIESIEKIKSLEGQKLGFKEKGEFRKLKDKALDNIRYLYLSKDYFSALTKLSSGLLLKIEQSKLVIKFAPYFDGKPVLDLEDEYEDDDDSVLGAFKEIGKELKEAFVSSTSSFSLYEYVEDNYGEQIEDFKLPDVDIVIDTFKKSIFVKKESIEESDKKINVVSDDEIECENCHAKIKKNAKFCPECGNKVEIKKSSFCTECGSPIEPGVKFCSNCGNKVN